MRGLLRRGPRTSASPPTVGERLVYAVGDIHGCAELLASLLATIRADAAELRPGQPTVIVFLGDYVDRGDGSREVIDQVIALAADPRFEVRALKGNHEEALLAFLDDPDFGPTWAEYGGVQTLRSYGVPAPVLRSQTSEWSKVREAFQLALPQTHLRFLSQLELTAVYGDYVFVHAGLRHGVALEAQSERDMLWIREEFLHAEPSFGKVVVHGHTPEADAFVGDHRIGIDTGAYATGVLTAVRLKGEERALLQATRSRLR